MSNHPPAIRALIAAANAGAVALIAAATGPGAAVVASLALAAPSFLARRLP